MKRRENIQKFYSLKGKVNATEMASFQTDLFVNGAVLATAVTTAILISGATTTAVSVTGSATDAFKTLTGTFTNGINLGGTITNGINVAAAATMTNFIKFNAIAGCVLAVDVDPKDTPSGGGLGADACIQIDIGGLDYYIPIFAVSLS